MCTSIACSLVSAQAANTQIKIDTSILKSNANAEKSTVLTLLGVNQTSPANLTAGIGGNLDVSA